MEYREFRAEGVEADEGGKLSGVLAPFNSETVIGRLDRGGWREEIAPGAFKKALKEGDTVLLCDHDMSKPLARVSAGTLRLRETDDALRFDADPADTSYWRDTRVNIRAGNKGGMSIGFDPIKDDWYDDDGKPSDRLSGTKRILREVRLPEGSVVTNPAYKKTSVSARDESAALLEARERSVDEETRFAVENTLYEELRATPVNTAARKGLAAKGQALPDGSYPIKDKAHLHAAAVLASSHHGNWKAAQALIRKMAKKLGVKLSTLPGFGKGKAGMRSVETPEARIKKGTAKRVVQMDTELTQAMELLSQCDANKLPKEAQDAMALISSAKTHAGHVVKKEKLGASDTARAAQEPETSTPDDEDDFALQVAIAQAMYSREFGDV